MTQYVAKGARRKESKAIISGDSDFSMRVGPGGPGGLGDLMLKDVVYDSKAKAIKLCTLIMGQSTVASKVVAILGR